MQSYHDMVKKMPDNLKSVFDFSSFPAASGGLRSPTQLFNGSVQADMQRGLMEGAMNLAGGTFVSFGRSLAGHHTHIRVPPPPLCIAREARWLGGDHPHQW